MTDDEEEDYDYWLDAVKADGKNIEDVPEHFKTVELCAAAVENYTYLLDDWGYELKDLSYLYNHYYYYDYKPESEEHKKVVKAIKEKREGLGAFKYVPEEIKDAVHLELYEQSKLALDPDEYYLGGTYFPDLPEHLKTAEMCLEEVKRSSAMLEYVPEKFKTAEFYIEAVKENGRVLEYMPEALKTAELCLAAVKLCGGSLEWVPENFKTAELCFEAVKQDGDAIKNVPEKFKTLELCIEAFKNFRPWSENCGEGMPCYFECVPESLKNEVMNALEN